MLLLDVNVLVYAHREDAPDHVSYRKWLENLANSYEAFSVADLAFSGFLRIVTHARVFNPPSPLDKALAFVEELRACPNFVTLAPGTRHWDIFVRLCRVSNAVGNLIPDAYFAALAIETGSEWITTDADFAKFHGLKWRHPLKSG